MVTIIKNQLFKHLSIYTKNLTPEQINVSALKGQGQLLSLQLDEVVLTELLELPTWMKISSATCGRVTFRVHWTKLKTMPIELNLEDVQIMVETCSDFRSDGGTPTTKVPAIPPARYSFIHKVIDGISISVNTVKIEFKSPVFIATVQLSRISVESRTPQWQRGDLRLTRLKDPQNSQILIFKEVSWQSARIEANAVKEGNGLPPLRLLTNQAHCRITIKKRLSDCFVVGSRLVLILEEALWVLTDRQLGAALAFADSLISLVKQSTGQVTRTKAKRKLETLPEYLAQVSQAERATTQSAVTKTRSTDPLVRLFARHDVTETSYHFLSQRIDLHLCDDPGPGRSSHPSLAVGAALQVSLNALQVDFYPYHLASAHRNHWPGYRESAGPHSQWLKQALTAFKGSLLTLLENLSETSLSPEFFAELLRNSSKPDSTPNSPPPTSSANLSQGVNSPARKVVVHQLAKLMTSCIILRLEDYTLYKVTTGEKKESPKAFVSADRDRFTMPDEVRAFHLEFTNFYYPGDIQFPIPSPKLFLQINPVRVMFDLPSTLWCNSFLLNLLSCLQATETAGSVGDSDFAYVDITVEAIMPRVIIDGGRDHPGQRDRPRILQAQVSRATITNSNIVVGNVAELASTLAVYAGSPLLAPTCCTDTMLKHASGGERQPLPNGRDALKARTLWGSPRLIWCIKLEPVWADFCGAKASPQKPTPLLDAVPFTFWVYINMKDDLDKNINMMRNMRINPISRVVSDENAFDLMQEELLLEGEADIQIVGQCSQLVSLQLNHYQFLFLLRLAEKITELTAFLSVDSARVTGPCVKPKSLVFGCSIPQVEVTIVLPSCCPGKESSRDLDSVLPDSSSLIDLQQNNTGSGTLCLQPQGNGSSNILSQSSLEKHSILTSSLAAVNNAGVQHIPLSEPPIQPESGEWTHLAKTETLDIPGQSKDALPNIANINAGISSVKRGFTSLMSSIDAALKPSDNMSTSMMSAGPSPGAGTPSGDQWDNASVASSDSERYIIVQLAGEVDDGAFRLWDGVGNPRDAAVEVAAEVMEQSSSPSERSLASSCRRRDLVSMSTFILRHVEVHQISRGFYSRVSANVDDIEAEDCNSIPWDELQSKFSSRSRGWMDGFEMNSLNKINEPKVNVKLEKFPHHTINIPYEIGDSITMEALLASFANQANVLVKNLNLTINMSTAVGLADFVEDEVISPPIPIEVLLESMSLKLNEDRPASSISSPGAVPIQMTLDGLRLSRDKEGVLNIRPASLVPTTPMTLNSNSSVTYTDPNDESSVSKLMQENEMLKRKLNALERLAMENDTLRRSKEETDVLKSCLLTAQDEVSALLDEKITLLDTVRMLQEQISGVESRGVAAVFARANKR